MFNTCDSLKFLDLSNFNITKVETFEFMLSNCISLIKLNFITFYTQQGVNYDNMLFQIKNDVIYCVKEFSGVSHFSNF